MFVAPCVVFRSLLGQLSRSLEQANFHLSKLFLGFTQIKTLSCPLENYSVMTHCEFLFQTAAGN